MNLGAWFVAIKPFLVTWPFLAVAVFVLAALAALTRSLARRMRDPDRDKELERLMSRGQQTLGENACDWAEEAVVARAVRDGWAVGPDPSVDIDRQPGGRLDPAFPFHEELKKELRRRLRTVNPNRGDIR